MHSSMSIERGEERGRGRERERERERGEREREVTVNIHQSFCIVWVHRMIRIKAKCTNCSLDRIKPQFPVCMHAALATTSLGGGD